MLIISLLLGVFFLLPRRAKGQIEQHSEIPEGLILGSRYTSRPPESGFTQRTIRFEATKSNQEIEEETKKEREAFELIGIDIDAPISRSPEDIEKIIRYWSKERGLSEEYVVCIARMESGLSETRKSKSGTYWGLFQFRKSYWNRYSNSDILNADNQAMISTKLMAQEGYWRWPQTSQKCRESTSKIGT